MIELRNITKKYGTLSALENVSLKVERGDIFSIIGPNGSGKTTILRLMAGIDKPTRGKVYFNHEIVSDDNLYDIRKKSTLVFQRAVLFNTTVKKNVAYGLKLRDVPDNEIDEKVSEVLSLVELEGYEKRSAMKLSGGEQQRVSLARALVLETDVLLLDEPTGNLDPKNVFIIEETLSRVNREHKTTIVIATHNMLQAESLTTRAVLLLNGRVAQIGVPFEFFSKPSEYLASFARLENVFSGTSKILGDGTSLIDLGENVEVEAAVRSEGKVTILVRPEDIILSKEQIISSARNVLIGKVMGISDFKNIVKLRIDTGRDFVVQITKSSFREMGLNIGSDVFLTFKASTVRII